MKRSYTFLLAVILFVSISFMLPAQDITYTNHTPDMVDSIDKDKASPSTSKPFTIHGSWQSQLRYYNVTGDGKSQQDNGLFHSHSIHLNVDGQLADNLLCKGAVAGSYDDQDASAAKNFRLDNLFLEVYQPDIFSLQFGDAITPTMSYYTLQKALEGFSCYYTLGNPQGSSLRATSLFGQVQRDFRGPRRMVYGYRAEGRGVVPGLRLGFDQVYVSDSADMPKKQDVSVFSLNGLWQFDALKGLELSWDLAHSFNIDSRENNEPVQQDGWGGRTKLSYKLDDKNTLAAEYEEASYDFTSPVGGGAPDRRSKRVRGDCQLFDNLTMRGGYAYDCNNLQRRLASTTQSHQVTWDWNYTPLLNHSKNYLANLVIAQNFSVTRRFDKKEFDTKIWDMGWTVKDTIGPFALPLMYNVSLVHDSVKAEEDSRKHTLQGEIRYTQNVQEQDLSLDTRLYVRYTDELMLRDARERNVSRVCGWEMKTNLSQKYQLLSTVEYQRLSKAGDTREGEIYMFRFEGRYDQEVALGKIQASVLVEYNLYNYARQTEEYDEFKLLGNCSYIF